MASAGRRFSSNRVHRATSEVCPAGMQESKVSGRTPIYTMHAYLPITPSVASAHVSLLYMISPSWMATSHYRDAPAVLQSVLHTIVMSM